MVKLENNKKHLWTIRKKYSLIDFKQQKNVDCTLMDFVLFLCFCHRAITMLYVSYKHVAN